jgi:beta-glucosidase-like glycosyl hydrolase
LRSGRITGFGATTDWQRGMVRDSRRRARLAAVCVLVAATALGVILSAISAGQQPIDRAAQAWLNSVTRAMTIDDKVGQLLVPAINAVPTPVDSDLFETRVKWVKELRVGGFHVFGGAEPTPAVLLNPVYAGASAARKGDPYAAADYLNRLQAASAIPLLATADFEGGAAYIMHGATRLPRAMAIGASRDPQLAFRAGQLAAAEGRSLGIHVNFYPVVDVNNNPRNPIINIRSFGEDVALVSELATSYMKGIQDGGMLATAKHFPGHGDTATDTHIGLALIEHPRERLDRVELAPYRALIAAGVDAVMSSHIVLPALDPTPGLPATLSRPILTGLLREELKFGGLVFTDSMAMWAISRNFTPERAAAMAVKAGADLVLDPPDPEAAFRGIKAAVESGEIPMAQIDASVGRILRVKARLGLHKSRTTDLGAIASKLGGRQHQLVADEIAARGLTLLKDEKGCVPLKVPPTARVLYLSIVDYASGWREAVPARTLVPSLKQRWPALTAIEVTDRTTASELDLIKVIARQSDAVVAGVFVRIASYSGRMDLSPAQLSLIEWLSGQAQPFVAVAFGNPYVVAAMPKAPALLVTYEFSDASERAAAAALAGEAAIGGKLPITIPGLFDFGHGLVR